jgi:BirA family transcriptional regulator, biotin operon repressor / biotin---[acetyl-CoA-carboxylase] ligase
MIYSLKAYDTIGSTNDEALRLAADGAGEGTVVLATLQTAGRGRARTAGSWVSPPGNLYSSVILTPKSIPLARVGEVSFVAGIALARTAAFFLPVDRLPRLKWPNDVLVGGAKISGILVETLAATEDPVVVLGMGLNVTHAPEGLPYPVTGLRQEGASGLITARDVLDRLLQELDHSYQIWQAEGFAPIRAEWLTLAHSIGDPVRVRLPDGVVLEGSFGGMDEDGALQLRLQGQTRRITAGDVQLTEARHVTGD